MAVSAIMHIRARQMMAKNHELEQKVSERTTDLTDAYEHLYAMKVELEAQNEKLETMQSELETQNEDLVVTHETLAAANEKLSMLASTDGLTGLKNHRSFQDQLQREFERMNRSGSRTSLIMLDIDHFKQFNDNFGHPIGDDVLRNVATILMENVREYDYVARYGGEEMIIIVPDADSEMAISLAERLRNAIEVAPWTHRQVTASFGVSTADSPGTTPSHLINEADTALYASKKNGRNRVTHSLQVDRTKAAA
jgi:diguanylate cyclase (GGDEF)-like protein